MKIHIHRGQNQIGGNVVEIATDSTKILLDAGLPFFGEDDIPLKIDGLFDYAGYDAVFISHYHRDHVGLAYKIHKDIPIYMGENAYKILKVTDRYKLKRTFKINGYMRDGEPIFIGDIKVTPYLCDHSAYDSYMVVCESSGERILYTGDFRSTGRKSFEKLLKALPKNIDKMICEGTSLSQSRRRGIKEEELEERAANLFRKAKGPVFVLQETTNIDRLITMYRAAQKSGRVLLQDVYMADVAQAAGPEVPSPFNSRAYTFVTNFSMWPRLLKFKRRVNVHELSEMSFVMCIRSTMLFYLKSLAKKISFEDGLLIYSIRKGYAEKKSVKRFLEGCEKLGLNIVTLHTSGHADEETLRKLIETVNPKTILPIHTLNSAGFSKLVNEEISEIE